MARRTRAELRQEHREFKERATVAIHNWAAGRAFCGDFDKYLRHVGLPDRREPRPWKIQGEDTIKAFEEWKTKTARFAQRMAKSHGYDEHYGSDEGNFILLLSNLGFPVKPIINREIVATGTFKVTRTIQRAEDESVVSVDDLTQDDRVGVAHMVYNAISGYRLSDDITWEITSA